MKKYSFLNAKKFLAFSMVELMISLIVISCITAAFTPVITKRLKNSSTSVSMPKISTNCKEIDTQCQICQKSNCIVCSKFCSPTEIKNSKTCKCESCSSKFGAQCNACSESSCKSCLSGYYLNGTTCTQCPQGSYCPGGTAGKLPCPSGTYSNTAGVSSCTQCPEGKFSTGNTNVCQDCEGGYYSAKGASSCISCPPGTYSTKGASKCSECPAGTYSTGGAKSCEQCEAGRYQNKKGQSDCTPCPVGYKCPVGSLNPVPCTAGTGSFGNQAECTPCPSPCATCSVPSVSNCASCKFNYRFLTNSSQCEQCEAGTYCPGDDSSTPCKAGQYVSSKGCAGCPAGQYSSSAASGCKSCSAGQYSTGSASSCTNCPAGKYSSSSGSGSCTNCPANQYQSAAGKTSCSNCLSNQYSNPGSSSCTDCTVWDEHCVECNNSSCTKCAQWYKLNGTGCKLDGCEPGYFLNKSNACEICPKGHYCTGGLNNKVQCPGDKYEPNKGQSTCTKKCTANQYRFKGNYYFDRHYNSACWGGKSCGLCCNPGYYIQDADVCGGSQCCQVCQKNRCCTGGLNNYQKGTNVNCITSERGCQCK